MEKEDILQTIRDLEGNCRTLGDLKKSFKDTILDLLRQRDIVGNFGALRDRAAMNLAALMPEFQDPVKIQEGKDKLELFFADKHDEKDIKIKELLLNSFDFFANSNLLIQEANKIGEGVFDRGGVNEYLILVDQIVEEWIDLRSSFVKKCITYYQNEREIEIFRQKTREGEGNQNDQILLDCYQKGASIALDIQDISKEIFDKIYLYNVVGKICAVVFFDKQENGNYKSLKLEKEGLLKIMKTLEKFKESDIQIVEQFLKSSVKESKRVA